MTAESPISEVCGWIAEEKLTLDVAGHYSRPDLFEVHLNRSPLTQLREP